MLIGKEASSRKILRPRCVLWRPAHVAKLGQATIDRENDLKLERDVDIRVL